jgi:hypothetical protein
MDLQASSRSAATLGVLALIFAIAVVWGWHSVTKPFPGKVAAAPICEDTSVAKGQTIQTGQVLVNVVNGGNKAGLAQSTQARLVNLGFAAGELGNTSGVPHRVTAEVWTMHPKSPAAKLVASYLGHGVRIVRRDSGYPGITVVVGDGFGRVHRGMPSIKAAVATTVCEPTAVNEGL